LDTHRFIKIIIEFTENCRRIQGLVREAQSFTQLGMEKA